MVTRKPRYNPSGQLGAATQAFKLALAARAAGVGSHEEVLAAGRALKEAAASLKALRLNGESAPEGEVD